MGEYWQRRPGNFPNGLQVGAASTFDAAVSVAGNVTLSADLRLPAQSLTGTSAAQALTDHGVSFLTYGTSGKTNDFLLPDPPAAGAVKWIFVVKNTSSEELNINLNSSGGASSTRCFAGTTFNTITIAASTVFPSGTPGLMLVAASTKQWAVTCIGSTNLWDFSASTGSTDSDV